VAKQPAAAAIAAAVEGSVIVARSMPTPAQQNRQVMALILAGGGVPPGLLRALARAKSCGFLHAPASASSPLRCWIF